VRKELNPDHPEEPCDLCGRMMLKGERLEMYLAPGGQRREVCDLCAPRAAAHGWIRESAHGDLPAARHRPEPRRSLLGRLRLRGGGAPEPERQQGRPANAQAETIPEHAPAPAAGSVEWDAATSDRRSERSQEAADAGGRPKDPRHVRAVPTNAEVKVERALELFNSSEHPRTIAGIARSLGDPWVSAMPDPVTPSEVAVVVAWELSWYRYRVDLGDADEPVALLDKGEELDELEPDLREWNGQAAEDGRLIAGVGSER
jgi:hypothetical protein